MAGNQTSGRHTGYVYTVSGGGRGDNAQIRLPPEAKAIVGQRFEFRWTGVGFEYVHVDDGATPAPTLPEWVHELNGTGSEGE